MTHQRPTPPVSQHRGRLSDTVATLAGTPDDHSSVDDQLVAIAQLTATHVVAVSYASVTARHQDAHTTVAASNELAVAVDRAQYADQAGPCLDALETGRPTAVPDIAATMRWPGFRDAACRLGLHTSLSIPLFAGRGEPVAALNLYGHDSTTMAALTAAVWATYDEATPASRLPGLDPGGAQLVAGLIDAFAVRTIIQQAFGIMMAEHGSTAESAYAGLRVHAADAGISLLDTARAVIAGQRF
jgi:hypothetical protein